MSPHMKGDCLTKKKYEAARLSDKKVEFLQDSKENYCLDLFLNR
jgi:hypothetical protein